MAKKYAIQTYKRDKNGDLQAILVDAASGTPLSAKEAQDYDIVTSTDYDALTLTGKLPGGNTNNDNTKTDNKPSAPTVIAPDKQAFHFGGDHNPSYTSSKGNSKGEGGGLFGKPGSSENNFGYTHKPGWVSATSLIPGIGGTAGTIVNAGWNYKNKKAVSGAQKRLGITPEDKSFAKTIKDTILGPDGTVGTAKVGKKSYQVSLDQGNNPASLTPTEVERRKEGFLRQTNPEKYAVPGPDAAKTNYNSSLSKIHPEIDPGFKADPNAGTVDTNNNIHPTGVASPDMLGNDAYNSLFDPADPQGRARSAFMDTIAKHEAKTYESLYGGNTFSPVGPEHPNIGKEIKSGPHKGQQTHVYGGFQFQPGTWNPIAKEHNLDIRKPSDQKIGGWYNAVAAAKAAGIDLDAALASGDPKQIGAAAETLRGQWTSLPGGIEAGTSTNRFVKEYNSFLQPGVTPEEAYGLNPPGKMPAADLGTIAGIADFSKLSFGQYAAGYYNNAARQADLATEAMKSAGNIGNTASRTSFGPNRPATSSTSMNTPSAGMNTFHSDMGRADSPSSGRSTFGGGAFHEANRNNDLGSSGGHQFSGYQNMGGFGAATSNTHNSHIDNAGKNTFGGRSTTSSNPSQMGGTGMRTGLGNSNTNNNNNNKNKNDSSSGMGRFGGDF